MAKTENVTKRVFERIIFQRSPFPPVFMPNSIETFIDHARKKGMDYQTIRMLLLSSGWKEKDIAHAMVEESLEMQPPLPPDTSSARDAFFHLLTFAAFYTTAISLTVLFFQYINRLLPDAALESYGYYYNDNSSGIRWSLAALIVAYPLFMFLSRFLLKDMSKNPEKSSSGVRRWLTYLTLFVTAAALMGDVITLVFYLLEGELSIRFILKVLTVLVIAGTSFVYYFASLRLQPDDRRAKILNRTVGYSSAIVVLLAFVWGVVIAGSPMSERQRKFDERRIEDFRTINNEVRNAVVDYTGPTPLLSRPLPVSLDEVSQIAQYQRPQIVDPETGTLYEYRVVDETSFELCAQFNAVRDESYDIFWNHPAGRHCFVYDVMSVQY